MFRFLIVKGHAGALVQYPGTAARRYVGLTPKPDQEARAILKNGGHYADTFDPMEEVVQDDHERHLHAHILAGDLELLGVVKAATRGKVSPDDIKKAKTAHAEKKKAADEAAAAAGKKAEAEAKRAEAEAKRTAAAAPADAESAKP